MEQQPSPEERMMAFVEQEDAPRENLDAEPQEEEILAEGEEQPEVQDEEVEVEEEQQESAPVRKMRLKRNGEEIEKTEDEVIALAQQGFDYSEKMHQLKQTRAEVEAQIQAAKAYEESVRVQAQIQGELVGDIAAVKAVDDQLAQFGQVDWNALSDADPVQAQKLFFQFNQLQARRQQLVEVVNGKHQDFLNQRQQIHQKVLQDGEAILQRDIPNWGKETKVALAGVAKQYGFNEREIGMLADPRQIKVLHDAMQWRKLQAEKPTAQKKVATATPSIKPGAKDPKAASQSSAKKFRDELRRTGNSDYAAKLIERTL